MSALDAPHSTRSKLGTHGIDALDWPRIINDLDTTGRALVPGFLHAADWQAIAAMYDSDAAFRSRVVMQRHGFGRGEYRYFSYPLPSGPGDYNCLHRDLYGEHVFPLQEAVLLAEPGRDFTGGEFVLTEQRPRMQSRVDVVPLAQGDAVVFAVHHRPVNGTRSIYRVNMRHGVSTIRTGRRHTLGLIFHDAT